MDPNATLARLLDAFAANDRDEAVEALDDLRGFIAPPTYGFLPRDPRA